MSIKRKTLMNGAEVSWDPKKRFWVYEPGSMLSAVSFNEIFWSDPDSEPTFETVIVLKELELDLEYGEPKYLVFSQTHSKYLQIWHNSLFEFGRFSLYNPWHIKE